MTRQARRQLIETLHGRILKKGGMLYQSFVWRIINAKEKRHQHLCDIYDSWSNAKQEAYDEAQKEVCRRFTKDIGYEILRQFIWGNGTYFTLAYEIYDNLNDVKIYLIWTKFNNYYIINSNEI